MKAERLNERLSQQSRQKMMVALSGMVAVEVVRSGQILDAF